MERKVGERFTLDGNVYVVCEGACSDCDCNNKSNCCRKELGHCYAMDRQDGTNVCFRLANNLDNDNVRERKVGEVFEFNGKRYECVKYNSYKCMQCEFSPGSALCKMNTCNVERRSDNCEVVFKRAK